MATSEELGNELATIEAQLGDAEKQAETASGADAVKVGGLLAALGAKAASLRRRKGEAAKIEAAQRADAEAKRLASEKAAALAALDSRRAALASDFDKWFAELEGCEATALELWRRYDALQNGVSALASEAKALNVAGVVLPRSEIVERVRRGGSPLVWYWRRSLPVAPGVRSRRQAQTFPGQGQE